MTTNEGETRNGGSDVWTIDKRISVGNLIVLVAYAVGTVWFMSAQTVRIDNIERMIADNKAQFDQQIKDGRAIHDRQIADNKAVIDQQMQDAKNQIVQIQNANIDVAERLTKLEVKFDIVTDALKRIDSKLPDGKGEK